VTPLSGLTIVDALTSPQLFGGLPAFRSLTTWRTWLVALKALYGLPLDDGEARTFCRCTGRSRYQPRPGGFPEAVFIVGRQAGKSRIVGLLSAFEAMRAPREPDGHETYALSIAQDQRSSMRSLFRYSTSPFDKLPVLRSLVSGQRADAWTLTTGVVLAAMPCRPESVRGLRARFIACDELAYFRSSENLPVDTEMLRACRPCLATTGGKLVTLSSPAGATGALWDLHRQHFGRDDSDVLVWVASAPDMNPTLPRDYVDRMRQNDPDAYRSEVLAEFRQGVSSLFDPSALDAVVLPGVRERLPDPRRRYAAFVDVSGGRHDRFAVAVASCEPDGIAMLDALWTWHPPFDPGVVIRDASERLRAYRIDTVTGDRFAAGFVPEAFAAHGVRYEASTRDRSRIYVDTLPMVNAARVRLLDRPDLLREMRGLERRVSRNGREAVDHVRGSHDDAANATCGALLAAHGFLTDPRQQPILVCEFSGRVREAIYPDGRVVDGRLLAMPRVDLHAMSDPLFADALACRQAYDRSLQPRG
jgi:hypothetical protein